MVLPPTLRTVDVQPLLLWYPSALSLETPHSTDRGALVLLYTIIVNIFPADGAALIKQKSIIVAKQLSCQANVTFGRASTGGWMTGGGFTGTTGVGGVGTTTGGSGGVTGGTGVTGGVGTTGTGGVGTGVGTVTGGVTTTGGVGTGVSTTGGVGVGTTTGLVGSTTGGLTDSTLIAGRVSTATMG
jgi:hypothetical protein